MMNKNTYILFISLFILFRMNIFCQSNPDCLICHNDKDLTKIGENNIEISMFVDEEKFSTSTHGELSCIDCHIDLSEVDDFPHNENLNEVNCGDCHSDIEEEYNSSQHGYSLKSGNKNAPKCWSCHGKHDILSSSYPSSKANKSNLPETCGFCHNKFGFKIGSENHFADNIENYINSIHGKNIKNGIGEAASCSDCHGTHNLKGARHTESKVNKRNIPETCGKCHLEIYAEFKTSIHGELLDEGNLDMPSCTNCHGEHNIKSAKYPESTVYSGNIENTCANCHAEIGIMEKYGIKIEQVKTYKESFHGVASKFGLRTTANCASCHGVHNIRTHDDPKSSVYISNIPTTCGKCHEGANINFSKGKIHINPESIESGSVYWINIFFKWFTITIIIGLIIHIIMDLSRRLRNRIKKIH